MIQQESTQDLPTMPQSASAGSRQEHVNFWKGFFLFWIVPRRYGPALAAGSLRRALTAHLLSLLLLMVIICGAGEMRARPGRERWAASPCVAAAVWVYFTACQTTTAGWGTSLLSEYGPALLIEPGLVLLAALLIPWCAGGDSAYSAFKRSLKNVCWSSTLLVPAAILGVMISLWMGRPFPYLWWCVPPRPLPNYIDPTLTIALAMVFLVLALRALLVGAKERVEGIEDEAAQWQPRCEDCGYLLVGLPAGSNCPECGCAVGDSLMLGGRRDFPAWFRAASGSATLLRILREHGRVLCDQNYFRRVSIRTTEIARGFWWASFLLMMAVVVVLGVVVLRLCLSPRHFDEVGFYIVLLLPTPLLLQLLLMFPACLWGYGFYGIRDYRISAAVCWYAAPLLWPAVLGIAIPLMVYLPENRPIPIDLSVWIPLLGTCTLVNTAAPVSTAALSCAALLAIPGLLFWWVRVSSGLKAVRYANV